MPNTDRHSSLLSKDEPSAPVLLEVQSVPNGNTIDSYKGRWHRASLDQSLEAPIRDAEPDEALKIYGRNIENYIGTVKIPVGLAGPLRVQGRSANGDYLIPLATTEAALVASYGRGMKIINQAGGCTSVLIKSFITRTPCFEFTRLVEVGEFVSWIEAHTEDMKKIAESTTRFGKLVELRFNLEGRRAFLSFDYQTGDASGQNMVTIATQAAFEHILRACPIKPARAYIEANLSGDKKALSSAFHASRGKYVICEVVIPKELVESALHTDVASFVSFASTSAVASSMAGAIGNQGHYANALAALYLATGQDVACVAESAVGITRFEATTEGDLYASVTLPNIMVGTVGGGTQLPSQGSCLEIMNLAGAGRTNAFAEVVAGVCLAGEISIVAAVCSNTFTRAHKTFARRS